MHEPRISHMEVHSLHAWCERFNNWTTQRFVAHLEEKAVM